MFAHAQASQNTNAPQRKDALIADLNTTHQFVSLANQVKIQAKRPKNKKTKHNTTKMLGLHRQPLQLQLPCTQKHYWKLLLLQKVAQQSDVKYASSLIQVHRKYLLHKTWETNCN